MGRLFSCPDCGNQVSAQAVSCPKCGRVLKKPAKQYGCGTLFALAFAAFMGFVVYRAVTAPRTNVVAPNAKTIVRHEPIKAAALRPAPVSDPNDRFKPGESVWVVNRPEAKIAVVSTKSGFLHIENPTSARVIEKVPGAAPGQTVSYEVELTSGEHAGQRVHAGQGTMTRDPNVPPQPEEIAKPKPGGDPRFTSTDAFERYRRLATDDMPEYTVLYSGNMLGGGQSGDVLIPSFSRSTPIETRERVARKIMQLEQMIQISIYSTNTAHRANISASYSKEHPGALEKGFLGAVRDGKFTD